jgi:hypothetical protein
MPKPRDKTGKTYLVQIVGKLRVTDATLSSVRSAAQVGRHLPPVAD